MKRRIPPPLVPELRRVVGALIVCVVAAAPLTARDSRNQATSCGVELKLLVISADGAEAVLPAITRTLDYLGTPYRVHVAAREPGAVTSAFLKSGCRGFYQAVIQTSASLAYLPPGESTWQTALTQAERDALHAYQIEFGVRQVNWYSFPSPDIGLYFVAGGDTSVEPVPVMLTAAGRAAFPYLAAASTAGGPLAPYLWGTPRPLEIRNAWTYFATAADELTTPLIVDPQGRVLAATRRELDGREMLTMTFDGNANLLHTVALGYGVVNWATQGVFVGERRIYMTPQVDDVLIATDRWLPTTPCGTAYSDTGSTVRMDGADLLVTTIWQQIRQLVPLTRELQLTMAFNGAGAAPGAYPSDTLLPAVRRLEPSFFWTSHTYSHPDFDTAGYAEVAEELERNLRSARTPMRLSPSGFTRRSLITPHVSGLANPDAMRAVEAAGVRYIVSDTSSPAFNLPPNTGVVNAVEPGLFEIPRRPTNLFFNVAAPDDWVAEYNCLYEGFWGRPLTYDEILDKESDALLMYMIRGEMYPWMFHQANLRRYDAFRTLLTDLLDATLAKYRSVFNLPVTSLDMDALGARLEEWTAMRSANVQAFRATDGTVTVTADRAVTVPITGLRAPRSETYGGQPVAHVRVGGRPVVVRAR